MANSRHSLAILGAAPFDFQGCGFWFFLRRVAAPQFRKTPWTGPPLHGLKPWRFRDRVTITNPTAGIVTWMCCRVTGDVEFADRHLDDYGVYQELAFGGGYRS